jgi:hypothetical protein
MGFHETDIFYPMPSSVGGSPKQPDKIDLDRLPISSMPLSVRGSLDGSKPQRPSALSALMPLSVGALPKLMPSNYRPNDIFHRSPALKRTGGYSYSSVDGDEEIEKHQNYVDSLQMEREKWQAGERDAQEARRKEEAKSKKSLNWQPFKDFWNRLNNPNPLEVPRDPCDKWTGSQVQDQKDYWECKTRKDWR